MDTNSDKSLKILIWVLKIGVFGIFLGHGLYAFQIHPSWILFLETVGFPTISAIKIMPYIGSLDILVAISVLIKPLRFILIWAVFWAFLTALIRPIAGGSILDFIERSGNWATPLALLILINIQKKYSSILI